MDAERRLLSAELVLPLSVEFCSEFVSVGAAGLVAMPLGSGPEDRRTDLYPQDEHLLTLGASAGQASGRH